MCILKLNINGNPIVGVKGCYYCPTTYFVSFLQNYSSLLKATGQLTCHSEVLESFDIENCLLWEPFVNLLLPQKVDDNLSISNNENVRYFKYN